MGPKQKVGPRGGREQGPGWSFPPAPAPLTGGRAADLLLRSQPPPRYRRRRHQGQKPEQQRQPHKLRHLRQLHVGWAAATSASGYAGACTSPRGRARMRGGAWLLKHLEGRGLAVGAP